MLFFKKNRKQIKELKQKTQSLKNQASFLENRAKKHLELSKELKAINLLVDSKMENTSYKECIQKANQLYQEIYEINKEIKKMKKF